jgi:hypothetical protein
MAVPTTVTIGQRDTLKGRGQVPAGVYESPQAMIPPQANSIASYFSRAGMPTRPFQIDQYVSFDGGQTWEYAGGMTLIGGPATPRNGAVSTENVRVTDVSVERGRPRLYKAVITAADPHDIAIDLRVDQGSAKTVISKIRAGVG